MAHLLAVEHVSSLRSLFELQDTEHAGTLTAAQLLQLLHACGETRLSEPDVQALLRDIAGHDGAGCSFEFFLHLITLPFHPTFDPPQSHSTDPVLSSGTVQSLEAAFRAMDGDGDGRLNSEDVWEALMAAGEQVSVEDAEAMCAAIDSSTKQGKRTKAIGRKDFIRVMTAL